MEHDTTTNILSNFVIDFTHNIQGYSTNPGVIEQIPPGGRLNKKDGLTRYGDSHVKDKTS